MSIRRFISSLEEAAAKVRLTKAQLALLRKIAESPGSVREFISTGGRLYGVRRKTMDRLAELGFLDVTVSQTSTSYDLFGGIRRFSQGTNLLVKLTPKGRSVVDGG